MSIFNVFKESTNSFEGQEHGEQVIMLVRRHPFFIVMKFFMSAAAVAVPFFVIASYSTVLMMSGWIIPVLFLLSVWTLVIWVLFFYNFTMYTLDVWIVTDRRIIDSTQHGFFSRNVSELHTTRVQDISVKIDGLIQSALHFGDVQVQTAGTEEKFKFIQVPDPEGIKNEIMKIASLKNPSGHL